jgi:hypothetical protein
MSKKYLLRFVFDYHDGRKPWRSQWDKTGPNQVDSAWAQTKTNLRSARIEAKDETTRQVTVVVECDGHEFVNFEWLAVLGVPLGVKQITAAGRNIGAVMVTREKRITVLGDGTAKIEERSEEDKKIHLTGFGR